MEVSRESIAALYREAAADYRPFYEDKRPWAELTMEMVDSVLARCEAASMAELRWRKETGNRQCLFGSKGCPPWQPRDCWGEHKAGGQVSASSDRDSKGGALPHAKAEEGRSIKSIVEEAQKGNSAPMQASQGAWEMFR